MSFYILPSININIAPNNLKLRIQNKECNKNIPIFLNQSTQFYLNKIKGKINKHISHWDSIKKYTNSYEFVHTVIPDMKYSISKYKPISRAFFKLVEIYNTYNLLKNKPSIKSFHLAEGPGGFVEATYYLRNNKDDLYYGMTLIDENNNHIPGWDKFKLNMNQFDNIIIERGADGTGNLYHYKNLLYCKQHYGNSMDIITGDGGFDFSVDFNNQENNAFRLIFTQVAYALTMQKYNGSFVLKIFDIFLKSTNDIIFLLSCFYEEIIIYKPHTSRNANSEKYIICKGFKKKNTNHISNKLINILKILENINFNNKYIYSIIDLDIPHYCINLMQEINVIFCQKQIDNINHTIKLITNKDKNEKIKLLKANNIQKCINWCKKNKIEYNKYNKIPNIFLKSE
jgi:23S rRNA U2552 (ribose-2'-O)-methylase RlmE/FtsJ